MKPAPFDFHAPETEEEVLALLAEYGEDARLLAGGQSLVPLMNMRILRPRVVISLNRCRGLDYLRAANGSVACGPITRQVDAEESALVQAELPLLAEALPLVGVRASRNRGTVCGSLAHADPLAELPSVAAALDARFVVAGAGGRREVAAADFFVSALTTCVAAGEMLREVRFPRAPAGARAAFVEVGNRAHGFAVAGVAAYLEIDGGRRCRRARLAALGMGGAPVRLGAAERCLEGQEATAAAIEAAAAAAVESVDPPADLHASADYRRRLAGVLVRRAVTRALEKGGEG